MSTRDGANGSDFACAAGGDGAGGRTCALPLPGRTFEERVGVNAVADGKAKRAPCSGATARFAGMANRKREPWGEVKISS